MIDKLLGGLRMPNIDGLFLSLRHDAIVRVVIRGRPNAQFNSQTIQPCPTTRRQVHRPETLGSRGCTEQRNPEARARQILV